MKQHLPKIMEQVQDNLNETGECIIQRIANLEHSAIYLKLIKNHMDPRVVQSCDVPVFVRNKSEFEIDDWDLTTQRVCSLFKNLIHVQHLYDIPFIKRIVKFFMKSLLNLKLPVVLIILN